MTHQKVTVGADWLHDHLLEDDLVILDGSWHLPSERRNAKEEYEKEHIPGALFFDLDKHSRQDTDLPHMMPDAAQFSREMGSLGLSHEMTFIIYDTKGLFSAARIWWMFRHFGIQKVYILNGGLQAWKNMGYKIESGLKTKPKTNFLARVENNLTIDLEEMKKAILSKESPLLFDARSSARFLGREAEPRPGVQAGHMPGAINIPYDSLLDNAQKLLSTKDLQRIFDQKGFTPHQPVIATCGSGVTACIILLALTHLGYNTFALYDGSWSEWGSLRDVPIIKT